MTDNRNGRVFGTAGGIAFDFSLPQVTGMKLARPLTPRNLPQAAAELAASYAAQWQALAAREMPSLPSGKRIERDAGGHIVRMLDQPAIDGGAVAQQLGKLVEQHMTARFTEALGQQLKAQTASAAAAAGRDRLAAVADRLRKLEAAPPPSVKQGDSR
jgi:hypothetical protein